MKMTRLYGPTLCALAVVCLFGAQLVHAASIEFPSGPDRPALPTHQDATDYSAAGLNLGQSGYLFFNFDAASDSGQDPVGEDAANTLPSWIVPDFDPNSPTYSFGQDPGLEAYSRGGVSNWASMTLPDGVAGLSGALVDPASDDNSNNSIKELTIGPGAPPAFWMHVVTDNTNSEHDPVNRIRARAESATEDLDVRIRDLSFNGIPDVYSFLYTGWAPGDFIKVQLNSGSVFRNGGASIAGVMFDAIPEPASAALLGLGSLGLVCIRRRQA